MGQTPSLGGAWGEPVNLSQAPRHPKDEPIILGDAQNRVHVFWLQGDQPGANTDDVPCSIYYTRLENGTWSKPNSILVAPNEGRVYDYPAVDIDAKGVLHFVFSAGQRLYYTRAHSSRADSARNWLAPRQIAIADESDIKVDNSGTIHLVFTTHDRPDAWYMRSEDGGQSWSRPVLVGTFDRAEGVRGTRLAISGDGTLHVAWSLDKLPRGWPSMRLLYARSVDGGQTWERPWQVASRDLETYVGEGAPWYLNVATDGRDRVFLTWDGAPNHERYFQQSFDRGATWQPRVRIFEPYDRGRLGYNPIVVDSADCLHVITGNYNNLRYTSSCDGINWSRPVDLGPEAEPSLAITEGNLLHLVGHVYPDSGDLEIRYYSHRVNAPYVPPRFYPSPPEMPTPSPTPGKRDDVPASTAEVARTDRVAPSTAIESPRYVSTPVWVSLLAGIIPSIVLILIVIVRQVSSGHK